MLCICASSSATYWHYAQSHWPYDTYLFNLSKGSYWLKLSIKPHLVSENSLFYSPSGLCRISKRAFILDIYIAPLQVNYYSEVLPTTALTMCRRVKTPKHYRQLWVEDLPKVPMWQPVKGEFEHVKHWWKLVLSMSILFNGFVHNVSMLI